MADFSDLLDDDFNISENLFDDFIQDLQTDTTNYQNLNSDGINFPGKASVTIVNITTGCINKIK